MLQHNIETCHDDREELRMRLNALTAQGARILAVLWQPRRPDQADQAGALDSAGSFVIVSESEADETRILCKSAINGQEPRA